AEIEEELNATTTEADKTILYVEIKTKRLLQVDAENSSTKAVSKYKDYDAVKMPAQPTVEASYADFAKLAQ
ncbi:MAG: hypothetical protein JWP13_610, partial [Candidatus Saccharibacteria bacterium]|nr:hypothetical protein [Candidatus Saccharibacteria bacterium]